MGIQAGNGSGPKESRAVTDLPDVNTWVALSYSNHLHHRRAKDYWDRTRADEIAFCGVALAGMLRILTQPAPMNDNPFSPAEAIQKFRDWMGLSEVRFIGDSHQVLTSVSEWAGRPFFTPTLWTDAWIAAVALENGCRVVSFDAGFAKFPGLDFLRLTD